MTHRELVEIAYEWVLTNAACGVAFKELNSHCTKEIPDVIGFNSWGHSVLIEVKVSRSDFLADKKKEFRANVQDGMGSHRLYCCPKGMIDKKELPEGWGLLYVDDNGKCRCVHRVSMLNRFDAGLPKDMRAEHNLLYNAVRRLFLRGRIDEIYAQQDDISVTTTIQ